MSRHRAVRNLDLDEELAEDDYYDEDPYDNLSPEDHDAMMEAYAQTLEVIGPTVSNGFTEREIKDILWDAYFDVDSAVTQLVEEKSRREAKAEKDRQKQESGEMQMNDEDEPTIKAFKQLSLQRDRRAEIRAGRGMPRGKAQGLRGLATGGRAGMAKRNLAGLAPNFVQDSQSSSLPSSNAPPAPSKAVSKLSALAARSSAKRSADNVPLHAGTRERPLSPASTSSPSGHSPSATPAPVSPSTASSGRTSKLAALAAARTGTGVSAANVIVPPALQTSGSSIGASDAPAKPLSKLQQRMLANKQQRQAATPEAKEAAATQAAEEEARSRPQTCFGSDLPISSLFPAPDHAQESKTPSAIGLVSVSAIAGSSKDAVDQLVAPLSLLRRVPGRSPFTLYVQGADEGSGLEIETVKKAFAGPSPDDIVMQAREGTRLGAK